GDQTTSDITVRLRNYDNRPEWFYCHSAVLVRKSNFFARQLSDQHTKCIEIYCSHSTYDHHVHLLKLLYLSQDLVLESWESVRTALGVLHAAIALGCEEIIESGIKYLEFVPWEEKEEEEIIKLVSSLGPVAMPVLAKVQPVGLDAVKKVFISAVQFATSNTDSCLAFGDELKTSAQEQVEYMLKEDIDTPLVAADEEVKSEIKAGLSKIVSTFQLKLNKLSAELDCLSEATEKEVLQSLIDLNWMCNILPKMDLMKEFVLCWENVSSFIITIVQDQKLSSSIWGVKLKLLEVVGKVLDAVGYGNVILQTTSRVGLLKIWLPFIRAIKPILDSKALEDKMFEHKLDEETCQNMEHSIISLVLTLPSNDQADILTEWMKTEQERFPDLSEAFEVWCFRTKAARRRLVVGFSSVENPTLGLE
ncbi:BTB/POZ domain-containing protein At3g05675-like, partial [Aristolochia californica]|uniref:BTB/POZ domain-containing protein At3g05675-like n=1 Tax=Aristolochia californica TaxID=171875 RepID=UPI0035D61668